jgi:DnaK suppressor protein
MDEGTLLYFKNILENRLDEILAESEKICSTLKDGGEEREPVDSVDFAASQHALDVRMRIQDHNHQLLLQVRAALERIASGEFGICEECGDDIAIGRLKAQPTTVLCLDCMREMEASRRIKADRGPTASGLREAVDR